MIIVIGEILIDRFPDYERIGGAPFNFAFHLKNMGWPVRLITRIGDDADGRKIQRLLETSGFDLEDIQVDPDHDTGRVEVTLNDRGIPHFDICEDVAYDHIDLATIATGGNASVDLIYFGSLVQRTHGGFQQVQQFLSRHGAETTSFCDINLRPPHILIEAIEPCLRHADILKLNDEELLSVSGMCNGPDQSEAAVRWLMQHYNISTLALTRGADGSTLFTQGQTRDAAPAIVPSLVDTVGAGDAYASVIAAGFLKQLPTEDTLRLATEFSARVCGIAGAIPDSEAFYSPLQQDIERIPNAQ